MVEMMPLFVGGMPGGMELAVILLIAILLFGANKIPKLARSTGEAMGEFKKGREEVEQELQEMQDGATSSSIDNDVSTDDDEVSTRNTETTETETESSKQ